jgi:putative transposase
VHSDQGRQYTATRFKDLLARHGAVQNLSRRGNCYDNTHTESFWGRFKAELIGGSSFPGRAETKLEITHHVAYHNAERRYSALSYLAPNHFGTQFKTKSQFCPAWLDHLSMNFSGGTDANRCVEVRALQ